MSTSPQVAPTLVSLIEGKGGNRRGYSYWPNFNRKGMQIEGGVHVS